MPSDAASEAFNRLLATELTSLNRGDLAAAMRSARVVRGWIDRIDIVCARRARELAAADGAESAEGMLIDNGRRSGREAEATGQREQICNQVPDMEAALAAGAVSTDHIDALARAAKNLTDDERADLFAMGPMLASEASDSHVESFSRTCRDMAALVHHQHHPGDDSAELDRQRAASKISRWVDRITGMHNTTISLDPLRDAKLWQLLDAEIARQKQVNGNSGTPFSLLQVEALFAALNQKHGRSPTSAETDASDSATQGSQPNGGVRAPAHSSLGDPRQTTGGNSPADAASVAEPGDGVDRDPAPVAGAESDSTGVDPDRSDSECSDSERPDSDQCHGDEPSGVDERLAESRPNPDPCAGTPTNRERNVAASGAELCRSDRNQGGYSQPAVPEVYVHIDLESLTNGPHAGTISELSNGVPLPVSTIRRMCCDANIIPVVLNGKGELLDVGREHRTATRAQRRALRAIYRTCAHPHCTVAFDSCRIHHIEWWKNGGTTDLRNMLPLCEIHHHQVHEGGWSITMAPDRSAAWHHPSGARQTAGPDRQPLRAPVNLFTSAEGSKAQRANDETYQPMLC